jgi:hypothetical protein
VSLKSRGIVAFILGGIAVAHIFAPSHVQIDWPTITLVIIALILVFFWSEIVAILPNIKWLRLGDAEIEMRDVVAKLYEEVEMVERTPVTPTQKIRVQAAELAALSPRGRSEASILSLAARDKETALILLAIEIEKELARLSGHTDEPDRSRTIRETLDRLVRESVITSDLANTILTFRDVRNKVVHPIRQISVDDAILTSAIDSGIRILRILRSR